MTDPIDKFFANSWTCRCGAIVANAHACARCGGTEPIWEWGCEDCEFHTQDQKGAFEHSDEFKHSLAIRPVRLPHGNEVSIIVCCRVDDPDPACIVQEGHALGTCARCNAKVRISASSVEIILAGGAQPWCIQCVAEESPESFRIFRRTSGA